MSVSSADLKKIEEIVNEFTGELHLEIDKEVTASLEGVFINIKGKDSALLIGYHGETLSAFAYLVGMILKKEVSNDISFKIDVAGYLKEKDEKIKNIVLKEVNKVKHSGFSGEINGLNAYERRIAHVVVEREGLASESTGFGKDRKLVIKPK